MIKVRIRILRKDCSDDVRVYEDNRDCPTARAIKRILKKEYRGALSFAWDDVSIFESGKRKHFKLDQRFMYGDYRALLNSNKSYVHRILEIDKKFLLRRSILRRVK